MTCYECINCDKCPTGLACSANPTCVMFKPKSRFVELPCEVGQTVYFLDAICGTDAHCTNNCCCIDCTYAELQVCKIDFDLSMYKEIGKTVFLSREEAENALSERSK